MDQMPAYFRAVALDYDGTITFEPRPREEVLASIARVRSGSRYVLLVTGRILHELLSDFCDATEHFDAIVAENGAVIWRAGRERPLTPRVSERLESTLREQGIQMRRGAVILALDAAHDQTVRAACVRLGLDAQLIRNRTELMVLPAGVSKSSGLHEALAELGISYHSVIGIGDAENDLALLDACEIGVAVGNAVASLKEQADVVLAQPGPAAVAAFLDLDLPRGLPGIQPRRRRAELGIAADGSAVSVPSSRVQVFIDGPTGAGKSYLAGLLAERLLEMGYTMCIIDQEGDHTALGQLRGVLTLGGREPMPPAEEVARIVRHRFSSVVVDLSLREAALKFTYTRELLEALSAARRECGLPHWILVEEAHAVASQALELARAEGSLCLVTYHPDWLPPHSWDSADVLITVDSPGHARLRSNVPGTTEQYFALATRELPHVRHRRKYAEGRVPYERGFTFRDTAGAVGVHVSSLTELSRELATVAPNVLAHHAQHRDFSRWIRDVYRDHRLAAAVRRAEECFRWEDVDGFRGAIREFIALRYESTPDEAPVPSDLQERA